MALPVTVCRQRTRPKLRTVAPASINWHTMRLTGTTIATVMPFFLTCPIAWYATAVNPRPFFSCAATKLAFT